MLLIVKLIVYCHHFLLDLLQVISYSNGEYSLNLHHEQREQKKKRIVRVHFELNDPCMRQYHKGYIVKKPVLNNHLHVLSNCILGSSYIHINLNNKANRFCSYIPSWQNSSYTFVSRIMKLQNKLRTFLLFVLNCHFFNSVSL